MKTYLWGTTLALLLVISPLIGYSADVYVRGYYRSDGTYVRPHYRSPPDGNVWNNWSTKGNINPYTGKPGYKYPLKESYKRSWRSTNNLWKSSPTYKPFKRNRSLGGFKSFWK